jgi:hypothetical protein
MSAPVTERGRTAVRARTAAIPAQRALGGAPVAPAADPAAGRRSAQQKAYAARDARRSAAVRPARAAAPAGRPQFVLLIMVLLAVGLVATLWLSTAAAADSYRLQDATAEARVLSEQAERLKQDVAVLSSAPELARRAGELGMVPVRDPARLVVAPDGTVEVVGEPRAAVPPAPPEPPAGAQPPAEGTEATTPEGTTPEGTTPDSAGGESPAAEGAAGTGGAEAGQQATGQEATGQESAGQESAGPDTAGPDRTGQDDTAENDVAENGAERGSERNSEGDTSAPDAGVRAAGGGTDAG